MVYRGTSLPPDVLARYTVGNTITEAGFMSTSYVKGANIGGPVQLTIVSKSGKKIDFLSVYGTEKEVLFAPGTSFKILERTESGGTTFIKMVEGS